MEIKEIKQKEKRKKQKERNETEIQKGRMKVESIPSDSLSA